MSAEDKDLPAIPQGVDSNLRRSLEAMREAVQRLMGRRGDAGRSAVLWEDLIGGGLADARRNISVSASGVPGPQGPTGPQGPAGATESPDLTKPPTPTGLTAAAGITSVVPQWDAPTYTGQGSTNIHGQTNIYATKQPTADNTPYTINDAVRVSSAQGQLTMATLVSDPAIKWRIWIKWQSKWGIESDPAGGVNGLVITTGQDVSRLLQALTGQITASQLATSLATPISLISAPASTAGSVAAQVKAETDARVAAVSQEVTDRNTAISTSVSAGVTSAVATAKTYTEGWAYSKAQADSAIAASSNQVRTDFATADAATLTSANTYTGSYTYSRSAIDGAFTSQASSLTTAYQNADAATLTSAQTYTTTYAYAKSAVDGAINSLSSTLTASFQQADTATLNAAKTYADSSVSSYAYSKAQADAAIAGQSDAIKASFVSGQTPLFVAANAWHFSGALEGWGGYESNVFYGTWAAGAGTAVGTASANGDLILEKTFAVHERMTGAAMPIIRMRVKRPAAGLWSGFLLYKTAAHDHAWENYAHTPEPTWDASGWGIAEWAPGGANAPDWASATILNLRIDIMRAGTPQAGMQWEVDWLAGGAMQIPASSATLQGERTARTSADEALAQSISTVTARLDAGGDVAQAISAAVQKADDAQASADGKASASSVTTLQAQVAGTQGSALLTQIQQTASTSAQIDGYLASQYTVRVSTTQAGRTVMGGFGISGTASPNAGATIDFGVSADKFWIGAPPGSTGVADVLPFVVQTSDQTVNGVLIPKGVYMDAAYIKNLSAMWARFGTLVADSITTASLNASQLTLGDGTVGGNLKSAGYAFGSFGWMLNSSGYFYAYAGAIGGVTISNNAMRSGQSAFDTGTGFWLGGDGKLSVGNGTTRKLAYDGATFTLKVPGLAVENGNASFSGSLYGANITGATGVFSGALAAGVVDLSSFDPIPQAYTTAGTINTTVPAMRAGWSSMRAKVTIVGGGAGGGGGYTHTYYDAATGRNWDYAAGGGGGGAGTKSPTYEFDVTPGAAIQFVVGAAGAGGGASTHWGGSAASSTPAGRGGDGGPSTVLYASTTYSAAGGTGGTGGSAALAISGHGYVDYIGTSSEAHNVPGGNIGGQPGSSAEAAGAGFILTGGAGGGTVYGPGGSPYPGESGVPTAASYGAAGAGGPSNGAGYAGRPGYIYVEYFDPNTVVLNNRYQALVAWLDTRGIGAVPTAAR